MRTINQLKRAAEKAVNTYRYRKLENCNLPQLLQLADEIKNAEYEYDDAFDKESFIAKNIGPTTFKSFCRFGDRKSASAGLILHWIKNDAVPLDEQAMFMSMDFGQEILPEELADFIIQYDCSLNSFPAVERINNLRSAFKERFGFNYNSKWIDIHLNENCNDNILQTEEMPF